MLVAKLDYLRQEIIDYRALKQQAGHAQAFATRADLLRDPSNQLDRLASIAQEFQRRGIVIPLDRSQLTLLAKQVGTIAVAYQDDPQSILAANEQRFTFWEPLRTLPNSIGAALMQAWSEYVNSTLPNQQQPELLQTLRQLPGFKSRVEQIGQLYQGAERLRAQLPTSPTDFDRISRIASDLQNAWAELPTEGMLIEVRDFLTAAVGGNASMTQLTGPVVEWLRANNLVDSVRISLKA